jgi:hypothetical protein
MQVGKIVRHYVPTRARVSEQVCGARRLLSAYGRHDERLTDDATLADAPGPTERGVEAVRPT